MVMTLADPFGRVVTQARISLNSSAECNFSCDFCHKEGIDETSQPLITPEEIERLVRIMSLFGVDRIKLTGGEPMLRLDIIEVVKRIRRVGVKEVSLSSNGTHLAKSASTLKAAGLDRVNISLHSLRRDRFKLITGADRLSDTIAGIKASIDAGLLPVKINVTLLRGVNQDEIGDLVEFSHSLGGGETNVLQLIELVVTMPEYYNLYHYPLASIEKDLKNQATVVTERVLHRRPRYELSNGVTVELVKPMHNSEFCMGCNRIRVTHDGKFKPCLMRHDNHVDFLTAMRRGADDNEIIDLFKQAVSLREPFFKPNVKAVSRVHTLPFSHEHTHM
jgi:cyclic pyranopterin phosphate synthase